VAIFFDRSAPLVFYTAVTHSTSK